MEAWMILKPCVRGEKGLKNSLVYTNSTIFIQLAPGELLLSFIEEKDR